MKLAALFSGGKDSCLALHKSLEVGDEVLYLLTIIPDNFDSFMFHKPYMNLLKKQSEELGIPLVIQKTKGEKEEELDDLEELIRKVIGEVEGIVVGGIASEYQGERVKRICEKFKLKFIAPLLGYNPDRLWQELLGEKFQVILTKLSCDGLKKEWLGKMIDRENLEKLKKLSEKYKFRMDFEGGEAESAVLFMPEFKSKKPIKIKFDIKSEGEYRHFMEKLEIL